MRLLRLLNVAVVSILVGAIVPSSAVATPSAARGAAAATSLAAHAPAAVIPTAPTIELLNSIGGDIKAAAISGTFAYVAEGNALVVLDISDPAAPNQRSRTPMLLSGPMATADDRVYVAVYDGYRYLLQIIDVGNPLTPTILSRYELPYSVVKIQIVDSRAYLMLSTGGFEIIDVSDPIQPRRLGEYQTTVIDMQVVGNLAYVLQNGNVAVRELIILDVSDPAHPTQLSTFSLSLNQFPFFSRLSVVGNRVYINDPTADGLITVDVNDPASPTLLATTKVEGALMAASGNLAYMKVYTDTSKLLIWDVSDPSAPMRLSIYTIPVEQVQIVDSFVYITGSFGTGLWMLNVGDPTHPALRGSYTRSVTPTSDVVVSDAGNTGYLSGARLQILDLTNPISPTLRGSYTDTAAPLYVAHTYAYAGGGGYPDTKLLGLDITNPDQPTLVSSTLLTGTITAITAANQIAYASTLEHVLCGFHCVMWQLYLYTIDVANPNNPAILGKMNYRSQSNPFPFVPQRIALIGSLAYIATGDTLEIIDISDPAHPQVRIHYDTPGHAEDVQLVGNLAYVADLEAGLTILNIQTPLSPTIVGRYVLPRRDNSIQIMLSSVLVENELAYLVTSSGLLLVDVHDPKQPRPRASYGGIGGPLEVVGDLIYVAGGAGGLQILRIHPDRFPSPILLPLVSR